ncbi:sorbosone dehydrogenase family protein, partial [Mesorhizobium sp. M7D.F.Ca.US.004.03.1.1]
MIRFAGLAISATLFVTTTAFAQQADEPVLKGAAAFGDWRADRPGVRRLIRPNDLPKPYATKSASNSAGLAERPAGAKPKLPQGFSAELI